MSFRPLRNARTVVPRLKNVTLDPSDLGNSSTRVASFVPVEISRKSGVWTDQQLSAGEQSATGSPVSLQNVSLYWDSHTGCTIGYLCCLWLGKIDTSWITRPKCCLRCCRSWDLAETSRSEFWSLWLCTIMVAFISNWVIAIYSVQREIGGH